MFKNNTLINLIVTCLYIGRSPYAPGTFGSLLALPICYLIIKLPISYSLSLNLVHEDLVMNFVVNKVLLIITLSAIFFAIGLYYSELYVKIEKREDPKEVVIDELAGQCLTIGLCYFSSIFVHYSKIELVLGHQLIDILFIFVAPFLLFRLCDIYKPWPIDWVDQHVKGGLGIMLDDILAAICATVLQYVIVFLLLDYFG